MTILYFTATGNSLAVAKRLGGELIPIPQAMKSGTFDYTDDAIGLVFPTYCCNAPRIVREFLSKAKLHADYLFAVATYGNGMGSGGDGNVLGELEKYAEGYGIHFNFMNSILMVDNFVDTFDIKKEIERIPSKKIDEHMENICAGIAARKAYKKPVGFVGKALTNLCKGLVKKQDEGTTAQKLVVNDACIKCGTCAHVCPRGNITVTASGVAFGSSCEGCYACLHACPKNAIHVKHERGPVRWRNPEVSVRELIAANDQLS